MRIGELVRRAGMSQKAVRYYGRLGLVVPGRQAMATAAPAKAIFGSWLEIRGLAARRHRAGPRRSSRVCGAGHAHSDDCPAALPAYRDSTAEAGRVITSLAARRQRLVREAGGGHAARTSC